MSQTGCVTFPEYSGIRCLMMPYIQGDPTSVPDIYAPYRSIIASTFLTEGDRGFLTIDESVVTKGTPHRGARAMFGRALHTEAGRRPDSAFNWWGSTHSVTLDRDVEILLANSLDDTCAVWGGEYENTTLDGDIGFAADLYPYEEATLMKAGEIHRIGILTPHESLPVLWTVRRQFLRIISSGVHGREPYFTVNPLMH